MASEATRGDDRQLEVPADGATAGATTSDDAGDLVGADGLPGSSAKTGDLRVSAGMEHLQRAALEMIAAARAFLDVAEDLVTDEERATEIVRAVSAATRAAARAANKVASTDGPAAGSSVGGIEHIDVR